MPDTGHSRSFLLITVHLRFLLLGRSTHHPAPAWHRRVSGLSSLVVKEPRGDHRRIVPKADIYRGQAPVAARADRTLPFDSWPEELACDEIIAVPQRDLRRVAARTTAETETSQ